MVKKNTFWAILLLLIGGGIYATCRQDVIFLAPFRETKFLDFLKIDIRYHNGNVFTYFFLFCLPDGLWYLSLLLFQKQFYNANVLTSKILLITSALLPFALEFLQYFKVIKGTFDILDICFYLLILIIFVIIWKLKNHYALKA